jgi:hypothetical protein
MKCSWVGSVGIVGLGLLLAGCGSDDDNGDGSGPSDGQMLSTLGAADHASLCDWMMRPYGGYGATITCGDETHDVGTKQECTSRLATVFATCEKGTVGQFKACSSQIASDPCDESKLESDACEVFNEACD